VPQSAATCKTELALALGTEGIVPACSIYLATSQELVAQRQRARDDNKLSERVTLLLKPKLLILDEMDVWGWTRTPPPICSSW
jgi:DNA replication protein DnaC